MTINSYKSLKDDVHNEAVRELTTVEFDRLKRDIERHGVTSPIIVNADGVVIDGHHRLRIWKLLKKPFKTLPVEVVNADDAQAKELAVSLNACRRHMSDAELDEYVGKGLLEGKSVRDMAEETGKSKSTIARKAQGKPKTETVKGQRRHSAKKPAASAPKVTKPKTPEQERALAIKKVTKAIDALPKDALPMVMAHLAAAMAR